jgi:hypothetical protein
MTASDVERKFRAATWLGIPLSWSSRAGTEDTGGRQGDQRGRELPGGPPGDVDVAKAIAKEMGVQVEFQNYAFSGLVVHGVGWGRVRGRIDACRAAARG